MIGNIQSIRLCLGKENPYWKITLGDDYGNVVGEFGQEFFNGVIGFRNQTFGIMEICNCMDLLKLGNIMKENRMYVKKSALGTALIASETGDYFYQDPESGAIEIGSNYNITNLKKGDLIAIESRSGALCLTFKQGDSIEFGVSISGVYNGLKKIYDRKVSPLEELKSAILFTKTICWLLKNCQVTELITKDSPVRKVKYDVSESGKVKAIGNLEETSWITISEKGELILQDTYEKLKSI